MIYSVSQKIDSETLCAFQIKQSANSIPCLKGFLVYLNEKCWALEINARSEIKPQRHMSHNTVVTKGNLCQFCNNGVHPLCKCYKFNTTKVKKGTIL